jgi:hypothetical protein
MKLIKLTKQMIVQRLKTISITISLLGLMSQTAVSEENRFTNLGCIDSEDLLRIETKSAMIHLCDGEANDGLTKPTLMYIYPKKPQTRKGFKVVKVVRALRTGNNLLYIAANGDEDPFRYTINARSRRFTITNSIKTVSKERIIHWCDFPGVANKCRF